MKKKIRYGRATLTVECWASLTPLAGALDEYQLGEATDEEVAWAFVRNQVVEHSPTFDWEQADLTVLLPRVTAVIDTPDMQAKTPAELIPELEELAERDRERWNKGKTLASQWADFFGKSDMETLVGEVKRYRPEFAKLFHQYTLHLDNWRGLELTTLSEAPFVVDPSIWEGVRITTRSVDIAKVLGSNVTTIFESRIDELDWPAVANRFSEVARVNQFPDAGEAVEATADAAGKTESVDELLEGLQPMFANLEKAVRETKDSTARVFLVALAVMLIAMMVEGTLVRLGVPLKPEAPSPAKLEPKKAKAVPKKATRKSTKTRAKKPGKGTARK